MHFLKKNFSKIRRNDTFSENPQNLEISFWGSWNFHNFPERVLESFQDSCRNHSRTPSPSGRISSFSSLRSYLNRNFARGCKLFLPSSLGGPGIHKDSCRNVASIPGPPPEEFRPFQVILPIKTQNCEGMREISAAGAISRFWPPE